MSAVPDMIMRYEARSIAPVHSNWTSVKVDSGSRSPALSKYKFQIKYQIIELHLNGGEESSSKVRIDRAEHTAARSEETAEPTMPKGDVS